MIYSDKIYLIFFTLEVLKLEIFNETNDKQLLNKDSIDSTFEVSKFDKSK